MVLTSYRVNKRKEEAPQNWRKKRKKGKGTKGLIKEKNKSHRTGERKMNKRVNKRKEEEPQNWRERKRNKKNINKKQVKV